MTLATAHADFLEADHKWFASNPDRAFRYHMVKASLAVELLNGGALPMSGNPVEEQNTLVLAYRTTSAPSGVAHSVVAMPPDEARKRLQMAAKHEADAFGLWLVSAAVPMLPRPDRRSIPLTRGIRSFMSRLPAA